MTEPLRDRTEQAPKIELDIAWTVTNLDGRRTNAQIRASTLYGLRKRKARSQSKNRITQHLKDHNQS